MAERPDTFENTPDPGWFIWGDDETGSMLPLIMQTCDMFSGVKKNSHQCNVSGCNHKPFCIIMNNDKEIAPINLCYSHMKEFKESFEMGGGKSFTFDM